LIEGNAADTKINAGTDIDSMVPDYLIIRDYQKRIGIKLIFIILSALFVIASIAVSLSLGAINIPVKDVFLTIISKLFRLDFSISSTFQNVIWNIRLPRSLTAVAAGMGLGLAGSVIQSLLRNPLASPFTLGITAGAGLGAALAISYGAIFSFTGKYYIVGNAFVFSLLAIAIVIFIGKINRAKTDVIILAGIATNYLFNACTIMITYFADIFSTREIMFWTVGSLGKSGWQEVMIMSIIVLTGSAFFLSRVQDLNKLSLGDEEAKSLGVNVEKVRFWFMILVSFLIAGIVSFVGSIGFVGLVAPHIVRMIIGSDNRFSIPGSALMGALLLVVADIFSINIYRPNVIPIGVVTSFIGVPLFFYLIIMARRRL